MGKGKIIGIILAIIVVAGIGTFFLFGFMTYGKIEDSGTKYYTPASIREIEPVVIRTDVGNIDIQYNTSSTPFLVKIEYEIKVSTSYMVGKTISDFFELEWDNSTLEETDKTRFILRTTPDRWIDPSKWFSVERIEIDVTLRTDIVYDIEVYATTGNAEATFPENVRVDGLYLETTTGNSRVNVNKASIGDLRVLATTGSASIYAKNSNLTSGIARAETTTGNLRLNFTNSLVNGDIDAEVTTGNLVFKSFNSKWLSNVNWDLTTTTGNIDCDIYQYVEVSGNVVADWEVTTGNINIDYKDSLSIVGASFSGSTTTGDIDFNNSGGFEVLGGSLFRSLDFVSANYTFVFDLETTTGNINVDGQSA